MVKSAEFFQKIKDNGLFNTLTQAQVDSISAIISECERQGLTDLRQVAYILATAYHECHNPRHPELRLTPMKEFGGETYLKSKTYYPYFGRGFSQLTWDYNYTKEQKRLGIPLLANPDLLLDVKIAANSHVYCMVNGGYTSNGYTGKKLSDYINTNKKDYISARKIVNGKDKAVEIAVIAEKFEAALT